jgi:hypothetical protein
MAGMDKKAVWRVFIARPRGNGPSGDRGRIGDGIDKRRLLFKRKKRVQE